MIISEIYNNISHYLKLSASPDVIWIILPLIIATIAMIIYFEKYKTERPGWNTYFSNSLVLLFISIILIRYIYTLNDLGSLNFINLPEKTIVSASLLLVGIIILIMNFKHFLPEKIAMKITSPITLNLLAYIVILFIYSNLESSPLIIITLLIIYIVFFIILNMIKSILKNMFTHLKKGKEREKINEIKHNKKHIEQKKKDIKQDEKIIRKVKTEVKKEEIKITKQKLNELNKQKKKVIKLKKMLKGVKK